MYLVTSNPLSTWQRSRKNIRIFWIHRSFKNDHSTDMDTSIDNETLLIIRCVGLAVSPKAAFKNVGMLSNIFKLATGVKSATNEKRTVKISQSAPFKPNGRPPNNDPTQCYISEVIEDSTDISPSLVASIRCPADMDSMIRVSVYYSSSLTGEKDVLLAGTSFTRKEVVRAVQHKGLFISELISEYCPGSKAFVEIMTPMPNVLPDTATVLPSAEAAAVEKAETDFLGFNITTKRSPQNPFKQRYVFYNEQDQYQPQIIAEESTWEPRFSAQIPALFMENLTSALMRSINAWNMRYELERKRQGRFRSLKEAITHGWHSVNVSVLEARIGGSRAQKERYRSQQEQAQALLAMVDTNPGASAAGNRSSSRFSTNITSRQTSSAGSAGAQSGGSLGQVLPLYNVCIPVPTDEAEGSRMEVSNGNSSARGTRRVLHDDSAPSTFVDIAIADRSQVFLMPLGRTNTEYYTMNPIYGSNLNQAFGKKASTIPQAATDCVEICIAETPREFYSYDTTDRDAVTRWHHQQTQLRRRIAEEAGNGALMDIADTSSRSISSDASPQSQPLGASLPAVVLPPPPPDCALTVSTKEAHFYRFISTCTNVAVHFDLCVEDPSSGTRKRVGTCSLPLSNSCRSDTWLRVAPVPGPDGDLLEDVELRVAVSVKSPCDTERSRSHSDHTRQSDDAVNRDYFSSKPSPAAMPEVFVYQRDIQGLPEKDRNGVYPWEESRPRAASDSAIAFSPSQQRPEAPVEGSLGGSPGGKAVPWSALSDNRLSELSDYRATIASSYEWMWFAGFNGLDPLVVDEAATAVTPVRDTGRLRKRSASSNDAKSSAATASGVSTPATVCSNPNGQPRSDSPVLVHPEVEGERSASAVDPLIGCSTLAGEGSGADRPMQGEDGADEDFQNHFESSRMSVFECSPAAMMNDSTPISLLVSDEFPLDASQLEAQMLLDTDLQSCVTASELAQDSAAVACDKPPLQSGLTQNGEPVPISTHSSRHYKQLKRARMDYCYPLEWIRRHVAALEQLAVELGSLVPNLKKLHREERSFRASSLKKEAEWQPLPINLHYQLMAIRHCNYSRNVGSNIPAEVVHSVTCGSMSPHMLGHKNGGLYYQESRLVASKVELDKAKQLLVQRMELAGSTCIPTSASDPYGIYKRLGEIGDQTLQFESLCLKICHRRAYSISQALSIAVNSLLLKLGLALQGSLEEGVCEQWLRCGLLLVFEGLLSVVSHERSMLEDTISAVDSLRNFQVRILPYPDEATEKHHAASFDAPAEEASVRSSDPPVKPPRPASLSFKPQPTAIGDDLDFSQINLDVNPNLTSLGVEQSTGATAAKSAAPEQRRGLKLELRGREVLLFVPRSALQKLPQSYQTSAYKKGGAVIPFYPVLFTQGIDIQQTMVTTFGGDTSKGRTNNLHLQHDVNLKGLRDINAYCLKLLPVSQDVAAVASTDSSIQAARSVSSLSVPTAATSSSGASKRASRGAQMTHPMMKSLHNTILSSSLTLKNVDLLIEVERLAVMLGGCRITFCKSGKDRTGMACTLEQSRQLGERYGCGTSFVRTMKDANLMRVHGCRLLIAEKNIGRKVYSINKLQAQFLPAMFRPPNSVCEDLLKKDNS